MVLLVKKAGITYLIDAFILLFQICLGFSILPYIFGNDSKVLQLICFSLILFFHFLRFGVPAISYIKFSPLYTILFFVLFFDFFQDSLRLGDISLIRFLQLCNFVVLLSYLYKAYKFYKIKNLVNGFYAKYIVFFPYIYYCLYVVLTIFLSFSLIMTGVLSINDNPLTESNFALGKGDLDHGMLYSFPGYLSVINLGSRLFNLPVFCGLCHEPHVSCYFIMPSLFMLLSLNLKKTEKAIIIFLYLSALVLGFSATAFAVVGVCAFIHILYLAVIKGKIRAFALFLLSAVIIAFVLTPIVEEVWNNIFVSRVMSDDDSSKNISQDFINYIITPSDILGTGNIDEGRMLSYFARNQIGLVTSVLDVSFFFVFLYRCLWLVFRGNDKLHFIGLACIYFALHSLKIPMLAFHSNYIIFMCFLLTICYNTKRSENSISAA